MKSKQAINHKDEDWTRAIFRWYQRPYLRRWNATKTQKLTSNHAVALHMRFGRRIDPQDKVWLP